MRSHHTHKSREHSTLFCSISWVCCTWRLQRSGATCRSGGGACSSLIARSLALVCNTQTDSSCEWHHWFTLPPPDVPPSIDHHHTTYKYKTCRGFIYITLTAVQFHHLKLSQHHGYSDCIFSRTTRHVTKSGTLFLISYSNNMIRNYWGRVSQTAGIWLKTWYIWHNDTSHNCKYVKIHKM